MTTKDLLLKQFCSLHPTWVINTEFVKAEGAIVIRATVLDVDGKIRSSGHGSVAFQSAQFQPDLAEQAEDRAIERALIHLFGGDPEPPDPMPSTPDDDGDVPGEEKDNGDTASATPESTAQPYLAGDDQSRRRMRRTMRDGIPRNFVEGTPGVPGIRFHRRPTAT